MLEFYEEATKGYDQSGEYHIIYPDVPEGLDKVSGVTQYGPSLVVYNSASFTDEDWEGIQATGRSFKCKDPDKIGRFGIGFNSIYHITDLPYIFSGTKVGIMDPQEKYFPDGGYMWSLEDNEDKAEVLEHSDQFEPLRQIVAEVNNGKSWDAALSGQFFHGTIFRFPLRNEISDIADKLYDQSRIFDLFNSFSIDAEISLLFLKHVSSITLKHISPEGQVKKILSVSSSQKILSSNMNGYSQIFLKGVESSFALKELSLDKPMCEQQSNIWLVSTVFSKPGFNKNLDVLAEKLKYFACVGLAFPIGQGHAPQRRGRLSCFLPLPDNESNTTGLPVHVNACFGLTDNRRYIKWVEEDQKHDDAAQWNEQLVNDLLPEAYCQFVLDAIAEAHTGNKILEPMMTYSLWPDLEKMVFNERWQKIARKTMTLLFSFKVLYSAYNNMDWIKPLDAVFQETSEDQAIQKAVENLLNLLQKPLVKVPDHVNQTIQCVLGNQITKTTPAFVCDLLKVCALEKLTREDKMLLLEFVLKEPDRFKLKGLKLLPLSDGSFSDFHIPNCHEKLFVDSDEFPRSLLPGLEKQFISKELKPTVFDSLKNLAAEEIFNLYNLNERLVTEYIKQAVPGNWACGSEHVTWDLNNPSHPPSGWLEQVWSFLGKYCCNLSSFEGLPIIPLSRASKDCVYLARLLKNTTLIFQTYNEYSLDEEMVAIIEKLGGTMIKGDNAFLAHKQLSQYVLPPSVSNVLTLISNIGTETVIKKVKTMSANEKDHLRYFLSEAKVFTQVQEIVISQLPVFRHTLSLTETSEEFVAPKNYDALNFDTVPCVPHDLTLPELVLRCNNEQDRRLLLLLKGRLLSAADIAVRITEGMKKGLYRTSDQADTVMLWILRNDPLLYKQNKEVREKCKKLQFLKSRDMLVEPSDIFDPEVAIFKDLFGEDYFPPQVFQENEVLQALRLLGLRTSAGDINANEILKVAEEVQRLVIFNDKKKSDALIKVCNETNILNRLTKNQICDLCALKWVPAKFHAASISSRYKPHEVKHISLNNLIGLVMPLTSELNSKACEVLGMTSPPPPEKVVENLKQLSATYASQNSYLIKNQAVAIYNHMQENLEKYEYFLKDAPIWNGDGFSHPRDIILKYPSELDLSYCVKMVPHDLSQRYSKLLTKCGVKPMLSTNEVVNLLWDLKKNIDACVINAGPKEMKFTIAILDWLKLTNQHINYDKLLVPVLKGKPGGFRLETVSKVLFPDISADVFDDLCQDDENFVIVHKEVPRATAEFLQVPFLSTRILNPEFIPWGQTEPISLRIKNILKEYDEDSDIFKELIQNAEDAGATVCNFLFDMRQNEDCRESLIDPGMALCHGPALWSHNDKTFLEEDFKNITKVGSASKESQIDKIGLFGLGFNSVYHITDVPSILSRTKLVIFDPNVTHLRKHIPQQSNPGIMLDLLNNQQTLCRFPGQFKPYQNVFGCDLKRSPFTYDGTLIRLPFRTPEEASNSKLSNKCYDEFRVKSFLKAFIDNSENLLIFLKNIDKVIVKYLPQHASTEQLKEETTVEVKRTEVCKFNLGSCIPFLQHLQKSAAKLQEVSSKCKNIIDVSTSSISEIILRGQSTPESSKYCLVCSCFGIERSLTMSINSNCLVTLPLGSVGIPLRISQSPSKWRADPKVPSGQVFCFLPFAIHSGLPVHINGTFSVTANRKNLWNTGLKGEWNKALLEDAVVVAYVTALLLLAKMSQDGSLEDYDYFSFWPNMENVSSQFTVVAQAFYKIVAEGLQRIPLDLLSNGTVWCSMDNARFLDFEIVANKNLGKAAFKLFCEKLKLPHRGIYLPEWVKAGFSRNGYGHIIERHTYNWSTFYREIVFENLESMDVPTRNIFILHAIDMRNEDIDNLLMNKPCIPAGKAGDLAFIKKLIHPDGRVATVFNKEEGRFPTGTTKDFLHPERLTRLEILGMAKDNISVPDLIERLKTIQSVWLKDKKQACLRIQSIMLLLTSLKISNAEQELIQDLPFLPAELPISLENIVLERDCLRKPKDLYDHKFRWCVNMSETVIYKDMFSSDFKISPDVKSILGLNKNPPVEIVLLQLKKVSSFNHKMKPFTVKSIVKRCYSYLNQYLQHNPTSITLANDLKFRFILVEGKFVSADEVAHQMLLNGAPYLYKLPEEYREFTELWKCVRVEKNFSFAAYSSLLQKLAQRYNGQSLQKDDLDLCLRIINTGYATLLQKEDVDSYTSQSIVLPDQNGILLPVSKLHYNDTPWLAKDHDKMLCHQLIPRDLAISLKVQTTKHRALEHMMVDPLSRWVKAFGSREKLTLRLKNIVEAYPSKKDILKEILQNADDAKATEVHFFWDQRQHPTEKIFSDQWAPLQGPAICVFNNKMFTEEDIVGIQNLGKGGKGGCPEKTGKYGLGFNSIYHLTDCPSFISGNSRLCVFDPNVQYLRTATHAEPGGEFAIHNEFQRTFPDVYKTYLPSLFNLEEGTLFRIPLRTSAMAEKSEIKKQAVTSKDVEELFQVLKNDSEGLILFLNNVQKITYQIITQGYNQKPQLQFTVQVNMSEESQKKSDEFQEKIWHIADLKIEIDDIQPYLTVYEKEINCANNKTKWIVAKQVGVQEKEIRASMQHISSNLEQTLIPHGGIATCVNSYVRGKAFCSLPLPVNTGLPVHVNGNFMLDSARRDLWKEDGQSLKTEWNELLMQHILASLFGDLLLYMANHARNNTQIHQVLQTFPCELSTIRQEWKKTALYVYNYIHAKKLKVIPVAKIEENAQKNIHVTWSSIGMENNLQEPHFLIEKQSKHLLETLQKLDMKLVLQDEKMSKIYEGFKEAGVNVVCLSPQSARELVISHPLLGSESLPMPLNESVMKSKEHFSIILNYCLHDVKKENGLCLEGLPLLVTEDGFLRKLHVQTPTFCSTFHNLFPELHQLFASTFFYLSKFNDVLTDTGYMRKFTIKESAQFIQNKLMPVNCSDSSMWPVLQKDKVKWIKRLWKYFESQLLPQTKNTEKLDILKQHFSNHAILPICDSRTNAQPKLAPLNSLKCIVYESLNDDICKILTQLGFARLTAEMISFEMVYHVIRPNVLQTSDHSAVLQQLTETKHLQWGKLAHEDYNRLLDFLIKGMGNKSNEQLYKQQLKSLPIFEMVVGPREQINKFQRVYILHSKFQEKLPSLFKVDPTVGLLASSYVNIMLSSHDSTIQTIDDLQFFTTVVLGQMAHLSEEENLDALSLLLEIKNVYYVAYDKCKNKIISVLETIKFIRDRNGALREASFFYDESNDLFKVMDLKERFIPQGFWKRFQGLRVRSLLIDLGMNSSPSQDDILNFANQVAKEARNGTQVEKLKPKINGILKAVFNFDEKQLREDFIEKLSKVKFIYPLEVCKELMDLHAPFIGKDQLIAMEGSMTHEAEKDYQLIWIVIPILPKRIYSKNEKKAGILFLPPLEKVLENLKLITEVSCKSDMQLKVRAQVLEAAYDFFQKSLSGPCEHFSEISFIMVEEKTRLVKSNQVVISLKDDKDFRPYLYELPPVLASFKQLFMNTGVSVEATAIHYSMVLREIHMDCRETGTLQPNQMKTVKRAVEHFFQLLCKNSNAIDFKSLKPFYLPATDGNLYESNTLYYNDIAVFPVNDVQSLNDNFKFLVDLRDCHLDYDIYKTQRLLQLMPEDMCPRMLSKTTQESLEQSTLKSCNYGEKCDFLRQLKDILISSNFREGIICLLKNQHRGELPSTISANELKSIFSKIHIVCCETLEIVLLYNSERLKDTNIRKQVYIQKNSAGFCDFFVEHQDKIVGREMVKKITSLAQEINRLMKKVLNEDSIFILLEMLSCNDPDDIDSVLSEHNIHSNKNDANRSLKLPDPGETVPDDLVDFLEMDFLTNIDVEEYVAYLIPPMQEERYIYAIVVECLGVQNRSDGRVEMYRIRIGEDKIIEVSKNDIYQFKRNKIDKNESMELVLLPETKEHCAEPSDHFSRPLEDIKKEIKHYFEEISKLPTEEREKAIRRLYLKWHPDKNINNEELANDICKYIQQLKEGRVPSEPSTWDMNSTFWKWNEQAKSHRKWKSNYYHKYKSYNYDFFSFHQRGRPDPEEAVRWFKQAEHDLDAASLILGQAMTEWVFFKLHQAVKKALIAAHYRYQGKYSRDDTIIVLAKNMSKFKRDMAQVVTLVTELKKLGVDDNSTQYPNYHQPPHIPHGQFPAEMEDRAFSLGNSVLRHIKEYVLRLHMEEIDDEAGHVDIWDTSHSIHKCRGQHGTMIKYWWHITIDVLEKTAENCTD
ncbi:SACS protein, partial [Polypterus senegalus]